MLNIYKLRMKTVFTFLILFLFLINSIFGQETGHNITVKMPVDATQGTIYLAHYFGNNQYIKVDSAKSENGIVTFNKGEALKGGMYLIVYSPSKFYDFVVTGEPDGQIMSIEADTADYMGTVKFKDSKENDILFNYRRYLQKKSEEARVIQSEASVKNDPASQEVARRKMSRLQADVSEYMKKTIEENKDSFAAKIININIEPELPKEVPNLPNGRPDSTFLFNQYKARFFENVDFSDDRILRTPFYMSKLDKYFKDLVYQISDSVIIDCDRVLQRSKASKEVYRFTLWWATNRYETTEIVGLDPVFIHLAENYYLKDADWLDSTQRAKFQERVNILKPLQTGLVFPELTVYDMDGKEKKIADSEANYTIVVFYSPDCGHCKEAAPKLVEFYEKNKNRTVNVFNISTDYEPKKIKEFIDTYKTTPLVNGWDAKGKYYFRNDFDVLSTPTSFVLDAQKRIIGKKIPIEELERFIEFHEKKLNQKTK